MPVLQLNNVPEDIYETISCVAKAENCSVTDKAITLLRTALNIRQERLANRRTVFQKIDNLHIENADSFPNPADLLRNDRDR